MADDLFPEAPIANTWKQDWPLGLLALGDWAFSAWAWRHLTNPVPLHWNISGQADGWGSPAGLLLPLPLATLGTYLLLRLCMSWRAAGFASSGRFYAWMRLGLVALFPCLHIALLMQALGHSFNLVRYGLLGLALFLLVLGNELPRQEPNLEAAPTPERRKAWRGVYRKAGRTLVGCGLALALTFWMPMSFLAILLSVFLLMSLVLPILWMAPFKALRSAEPASSLPFLGIRVVPSDGLALGGFILLTGLGFWRTFHLPILWVGIPVLTWSGLTLESRCLRGEVHRVTTFLRGWFLLGLCLSLACKAIPSIPASVLITLLLPVSLVGLGQFLASRSALADLQAWGQGPVLWDAEDPRVLVPKGLGIGWSFNFAHGVSWLLLLAMIGLPCWLAL